MTRVIVVLDGTEKRLLLREIEALLTDGDVLEVCESRLVDVKLIDKRPGHHFPYRPFPPEVRT